MPAADVPPAWVDPSHLMTAIINVAVIARDAMPAGGKLVFEGRSAVAGSDLSAAHYVLIAVGVSSSGSAIEDRVFADLGLVENLITQSDGHVRVCCEAARVTSVEIYLPKADLARSRAGRTASHAPPPR